MEFNRKFRIEPENYPQQIYFVNKTPQKWLETAKKFGLPIIEPEDNNNVTFSSILPHTIYVLSDFENHALYRHIINTPDTWILGPTALEEMVNNPDLEIRSKPTYCTFMYGFVFYINCPENIPLMQRMVQLLKWMGGLFCCEPMSSTTHMITTSTLAKGYTYCNTFNLPILSPEWVEYCWNQRNIPHFNVKSVMDSFKVLPFWDLYIAFKGFNPEGLSIKEGLARENGAVVVTFDDPRCTHLVFSHCIASYVNINDVPPHIPYVVKEEWFSSSIEHKERTYEGNHQCFTSKEIRKSLWAMSNTKNTSESQKKKSIFKASLNKEDQALLEMAKIKSQDVTRKLAFEELLTKETNYLYCLKSLLDIQLRATDTSQDGGAILNQTEARIIFGNLGKLVEIHKELSDNFKDVLMNWKNDAITVQQIIKLKDGLSKEYISYTNNFKESKKMIEQCETKNKRFQKLLEHFMKITKEHPKDLFIRPIQRLCSVVLHLREISKHTREDNPDKKVLNEAIQVVNDVLIKVNDSQAKVEKFMEVFDIHQLIKDCPPDLITSNREFIVQFSAQEVATNQNSSGLQVMFFLFNDRLEITKIRTKAHGVIQKTASLKKNPFKHIVTLPLFAILRVILFEGKNKDDQNMFGFDVKDIKQERSSYIYSFQYLDDNGQSLKDTVDLIAKQLALEDPLKSPKDYIIGPIPTTRFNFDSILPKQKLNLVGGIPSALDKMGHLLKTTPNKPMRRSVSCGDLIEPTIVL